MSKATQRLDEIAARLAAATPGPWYVKRCSSAPDGEACRISDDKDCDASYEGVMYDASYDECHHVMDLGDATLIAHAPADLALLLGIVRELCAVECDYSNGCAALKRIEESWCWPCRVRRALEVGRK